MSSDAVKLPPVVDDNSAGLPHAQSSISGFAVLSRVVVNVTSLLTSDILNRAATFAVYVMVARFCGSHSFGQLSLGLMLLSLCQMFAGAGLPTLITREVAKEPRSSGRYFAGASIVAACASVVSFLLLLALVVGSRYPQDTAEIVLILGLSALPGSLTWVNEAVLRAWERMHMILFVALPVNLLKVGAAYYLLSTGHGVRSIALVLLGCQFLTMLVEWPIVMGPIHWRELAVSFQFCRGLVERTWRFLGIDSLSALWGSINTVLLSWFVGETAVGLFGAAYQLLVPVSLTLQAIDVSLFPMMCRRADDNRRRVQQLTILMLEVLAFLAVPGCILLYFNAGYIISLVYGHEDFASSVLVLRIMLPMLLMQAVVNTLGQLLYSHRREHVTLRIVAINVAFNTIIGTILIYSFGLVGAAVTVLLTWTLNALLHFLATRETLSDETGKMLAWNTTLIAQVVAAGAIMAVALALANEMHFIVASILTSLLYLVVLAGFVYIACRGSIGLRERFLVPLKER